ncbi:MAG: flagellar basal body P-ring formation chaperone FlgA, partial [Planctomycetota bacterium]
MTRSLPTAALLLAGSLVANAAEVRLLDEATPAGTIVRLGDIAVITSASLDERDRLAAVPLMPTPSPGTRQFLSAAAVRELLAAHGESPAAHRFSGAFQVQVGQPAAIDAPRSLASARPSEAWRPTRRRSPAAITGFRSAAPAPAGRSTAARRISRRDTRLVEERVRSAIQALLDASDSGEPLLVRSVQVTETAVRELAGFEADELTAEAVETPQSGRIRFTLKPTARVGGEPHRVVAAVVAQPFRLVAIAPMTRGALVTASSVAREAVPHDELDRSVGGEFAELEDVIGYETSRSLRAGDVLTSGNCSPPMLVRRNDEVAIYSGGGGIRVKLFGIARDAGRRGDLVSVEAYDGGERFNARVVGTREVAVLSAGLRLADFGNDTLA